MRLLVGQQYVFLRIKSLKGHYAGRQTIDISFNTIFGKYGTSLKNSKKSFFMDKKQKSSKVCNTCSQKLSNDSKTWSQKGAMNPKFEQQKYTKAQELGKKIALELGQINRAMTQEFG